MAATFTVFQNTLPDPLNKIGYAGQSDANATGASNGPGYASVKFSSEQPVIRDRTNSGRILARAVAAHNWKINITYNPMTREEFEPVFNFLLQRRGGLNPFYVSLPQYSAPQDTNFATFVDGGIIESKYAYTSGATKVFLKGAGGYTTSSNGIPRPGDIFTISGTNSNHKKVYQVTRTETNSDYNTALTINSQTQPLTDEVRIHFVPALQKNIDTGDDFIFNNPLVKVILASDIQEYSLNTNNLYSFSLNLEEVQ